MVSSLFAHESSPLHLRSAWILGDKDPFTELKDQFSKWTTGIREAEEVFIQNVYENPKCSDFDLRQHRCAILRFLAFGETLAVDLIALKRADASDYIHRIDEENKKL